MERAQIKPVKTSTDLKVFFNLPRKLYKDDPNYVESLRMDLKKMFNKKKNPFFKHGDAQVFLAYKGKNVVGSITAIHNRLYNEFHNDKTGFFAFFECVNDAEVAQKLFTAAEMWLRERGLKQITGPLSFSTETISPGLLIKGYEYPPYLLTAHTLSYYPNLVDNAGFIKAMDVLAFRIPIQQEIDKRLVELVEKVKKTRNISIRFFDPKNFWRDAKIIIDIYSIAWKDNWGFVPPTEEELNDIVRSLKQIYIRELTQIAEINGKPVGWGITLPNINEALKHINGRLFPFGILKLLYWAKKIKGLRMWGLGILPEYRKRGVDVMLYYHSLIEGQKLGYTDGELSWVLETNTDIINVARLVKGEEYKRYRIYTKNL